MEIDFAKLAMEQIELEIYRELEKKFQDKFKIDYNWLDIMLDKKEIEIKLVNDKNVINHKCDCGQKYKITLAEEKYKLYDVVPEITTPFDNYQEIRCINCGLFYTFNRKIKKLEVEFE